MFGSREIEFETCSEITGRERERERERLNWSLAQKSEREREVELEPCSEITTKTNLE